MWQSIEIAYFDAYGEGTRPWEWDPSFPLRSPVVSGIFRLYYEIIKYIQIDTPDVLIIGPKIMCAFLAALMDFYLLKMIKLYFPSEMLKYGIFIIYTIPYSVLCATRPLTNSIEGIFMTIALYYWVKEKTTNDKK